MPNITVPCTVVDRLVESGQFCVNDEFHIVSENTTPRFCVHGGTPGHTHVAAFSIHNNNLTYVCGG